MNALLSFVVAALALAGSPGPANLSLAATAAAFGARRGLGYMAGILVGMVVVMAITSAGVISALLAIPGVAPIVTGAVVLYFAYLALRIAAAPPLCSDVLHRPRPSFLGGLLLSLLNPKGYAAMAALFAGFVLVEGRPGLDVALKMALLTAIVATVSALWLAAGNALAGRFRDRRANRIVNVIFAALLILSLVGILWR